ncbi:enoyl-CoA hydratase/isomerase family protein [Nocardia farcinica]|uniref:enoyl-CoA hydratase/isomerase family protein n=1 Tax=Nocardia farcinica TaxID=37329 RepID=UPI0037B3CE10
MTARHSRATAAVRPPSDIAAGCDRLIDAGLEVSAAGTPERPMIVVDLDPLCDAAPGTVARAAASARQCLPLLVGVLRRPPTGYLGPILAATTLTLTDRAVSDLLHQVVPVEDVDEALETLHAAVTRSPGAAMACGQLLRQTVHLDTTRALAAEAAVYSMLLGGPEFDRWLSERGPVRLRAVPDRDLVQVLRSGNQLSITLNDPDRRNALSARLREELLAALDVARADPTVTSVWIHGAGPVFCSGGDLDEFGRAVDPVAAYLVRLDRAPWRVMDQVADRLTVHVHGGCIGAGLEMAAFAQHIVAEADTWFQLPEVRMGLVPGAGGTVSVPRRIGRWRAAWLMLTGERLSAQRALRWGLVDRLADRER